MKKLLFIGMLITLPFLFPTLVSSANSGEISVNTPTIGDLPSKETINTYILTLNNPGRISLTFSHDNLNNNYNKWNVRLYDKDGTNLLTMVSKGNTVDLTTTKYSAAKGTYYVEVTSDSNSSFSNNYWSDVAYTIIVNYEENTGQYEIDQAVTSINVNKNMTGNIFSINNKDTYELKLKTPGRISLTFKHSNLNDNRNKWNIRLYDKNGTNLIELISKGNDVTIDSTNYYAPSGTYYVEVTADSNSSFLNSYWSDIDYTFKINYKKNAGKFEIEGKTNKLTLNKAITGKMTNSSDTDEFSFNLKKEQKINLIFKHVSLNNASVFWNVKLIDNKGKELLVFDVKGNEVTTKSNSIKLAKGKYTVVVSSPYNWNWSDIDYNLTVK